MGVFLNKKEEKEERKRKKGKKSSLKYPKARKPLLKRKRTILLYSYNYNL